MADYIRRDIVLDIINTMNDTGGFAGYADYCTLFDEIDTMPATDIEPSDRWINAQTNPPIATDGETSDYVLVLRADGRQCVCYYIYDNDEGNCWCSEDERSIYDIDEVTHWQPLPKTPKEN